MKRKTTNRMGQAPLIIGFLALALTVAAVLTMPLAVSKYVATGQASATARIAAFDSITSTKYWGSDAMVYWHKLFLNQGSPTYHLGREAELYIYATNESEVAVTMEPVFYNVRQPYGTPYSHGTIGRRPSATGTPDFSWSNALHRQPLIFEFAHKNPDFPPFEHETLLIGGMRASAVDSNGNLTGPRLDDVAYRGEDLFFGEDALGGIKLPIVKPGETMAFVFTLHGSWARRGFSAAQGTLPRQDYNMLGTQDASVYNAVFRLNYDIITTQVD